MVTESRKEFYVSNSTETYLSTVRFIEIVSIIKPTSSFSLSDVYLYEQWLHVVSFNIKSLPYLSSLETCLKFSWRELIVSNKKFLFWFSSNYTHLGASGTSRISWITKSRPFQTFGWYMFKRDWFLILVSWKIFLFFSFFEDKYLNMVKSDSMACKKIRVL